MSTADPILTNLIRLVDHLDRDGHSIPTIPLVLHMGGMLIMGDLITERQFAEASAALVKVIHQHREDTIADTVVSLDLTFDALPDKAPQYIHLKHTTLCIPGGVEIPEASTEHWRGRLDRIDGFLLGDTL